MPEIVSKLKQCTYGDLLSVVFPTNEISPTKREVLRQLAKVYDPLGFVSPLTLDGKLIYCDICNQKLPRECGAEQLTGESMELME